MYALDRIDIWHLIKEEKGGKFKSVCPKEEFIPQRMSEKMPDIKYICYGCRWEMEKSGLLDPYDVAERIAIQELNK